MIFAFLYTYSERYKKISKKNHYEKVQKDYFSNLYVIQSKRKRYSNVFARIKS